MSVDEAHAKWMRLAKASGADLLLTLRITNTLVAFGAFGGPDALIGALDHIKRNQNIGDLEREKALRFVEDTIVISPRDLTLDNLMHSPCTIQLALDDEMQAFAKKRFNDYWKFIARGPWANDIVRDHIYDKYSLYRYSLPNFPDFGDKEKFRPGPYSRSDVQEWLDSKAWLNFQARAILDSNNRATPQDQLLDMFGSLSLDTDGDNGDNGGSTDTS
ncbi:hypothetical protein N0V85_002586 [Neurospora sp. IMI 360204]|nr:hypothetical protein N0V85_002586 [Neurospora sp. IMI 360204]